MIGTIRSSLSQTLNEKKKNYQAKFDLEIHAQHQILVKLITIIVNQLVGEQLHKYE